VETKVHLCFLRKVGGRCGSVYGTEGGAVGLYMEPRGALWVCIWNQGGDEPKNLGTADVNGTAARTTVVAMS
jgi:hypothetical protein